jgi:DNA-directed RNA polymerase subunit RPC12/RpoP
MSAENERLKRWIDDLQSGMYINCVYCGHRYGPKDKVPTSMADALKLHIAQCEHHPMHQLLKTLKAGRDLIVSLLGEPLPLKSHSIEDVPAMQWWLSMANSAIDAAEKVEPRKTAKEKK